MKEIDQILLNEKLDKESKELVVKFLEKLNLIDKKSDSGDAQYVKSIL